MTDVFDVRPGRLIIRRTNGSTYLDSADRTLVYLGSRTYGNVKVSFPKFSSEFVTNPDAVTFRQDFSIGQQTVTLPNITLGSIGTVAPKWMMVLVNGTRTAPSGIGGSTSIIGNGVLYLQSMFPEGAWMPLNGGSLWVEQARTSGNDDPFVQRIMTVQTAGSTFVVTRKQSSRAFVKEDETTTGSGSTASSFNFNISIEWGTFDL